MTREELTIPERLYKVSGHINDILMFPMFATIIMESSGAGGQGLQYLLSSSNQFFCITFFIEWFLGLVSSRERKTYFFHWSNLVDLISTIPLGHLFQGLRIFRLMRLFRLLRVVVRAKRYRGKGEELLRVVAIVGATIFAGAYTIQIVEPQMVDSFVAALWWSLVTVSTVGYGDIFPTTTAGRTVAVILILIGVGVCGYVAGFMTNILADEEDDSDRLDRLEDKLDILAHHLEIADWPETRLQRAQNMAQSTEAE
ncbi:MAG: potassium channel family protein [Myxococcota bacterium]